MKTLIRGSIVFAAVVVLVVTASALPPLPKYIEDHYSSRPEQAKFMEMYKGLEMEHKCDACHKPGADKKAKGHALNDFGLAVARNFKHRDFNKADKLGKDNAEEAAKAKQLIVEALAKAEEEKNAAGQAFGELIKAGQMPGKN
jgi:hypothetical protein